LSPSMLRCISVFGYEGCLFKSSPVCLSLCEGMLSLLDFSKNGRKNSVISCFLQNSFLCLYTVLLYRLTGKLINYYRKPSKLHIVQWRATPSGSFREPVDYKGQEPSNLVFSEFRRSSLCSKTFFILFCTIRGPGILAKVGTIDMGFVTKNATVCCGLL
jgi:hypothetical protein